jgi:hypothetical protein
MKRPAPRPDQQIIMPAPSASSLTSLKLNRRAKTCTSGLADVCRPARSIECNLRCALEAVIRLRANLRQPSLNRPPELTTAAARHARKTRRRRRYRLHALHISAAPNSRRVPALQHACGRSRVRTTHNNALRGTITRQSVKLVRARPDHSRIVTTASPAAFSKPKLHGSTQPGTETLAHQIRTAAALVRHSLSTLEARIALRADLDIPSLSRPPKLRARLAGSCRERRRWRWWRRCVRIRAL